MKSQRTFCPYCDSSWQFLRIVFGKTTLIHICKEKDFDYIGWFNDEDSIPFVVPNRYMEWQ